MNTFDLEPGLRTLHCKYLICTYCMHELFYVGLFVEIFMDNKSLSNRSTLVMFNTVKLGI